MISEMEERADKLWAMHAEFMKKTHVKTGDNELLFYHVCKGFEVEDFTMGPAATKTGRITYTIIEFYRNSAGLDNHFAMFAAGHAEMSTFGPEFMDIIGAGAEFHGHGYLQTFTSVGHDEFPDKYDGFKP